MGKVKSAICLALATLIIAALSFICFVALPAGGGSITQFDPVVTWIDKDANLGVEYGANDSYRGGGYLATLYPEGVISAAEFRDNLNSMQEGKEKTEYAERYTQIGNLCFDAEENLDAEGKVTEEFVNKFNYAKDRLTERYERMNIEGFRLDVADGYALRVFVPQAASTAGAYASTFSLFANMGDLEVQFGSDEASATTALPATGKSIGEYVKGASTATDGAGTHYVVINFTSAGQERLAARTADVASSGSGTLFFKVGENTVISLSITSAVEDDSLYISNPSSPFSAEAAEALAILIDTTANAATPASDVYDGDFSLNLDSVVTMRALYGDSALVYMYIAFGVLFVLMMAFFFVRYGLLGFVHLYTYLFFLLVTLLCMWSLSFITVSAYTFAAVLLASLLLSASQAFVYERARKEYVAGKTMSAAVKNAYKSTFWHIFDLHIVVAGVSFITYAIALTHLSGFAFMLGLCSLFSGISVLAIGRFMWMIMMRFTTKQGKFCNFKRKEVEDDED